METSRTMPRALNSKLADANSGSLACVHFFTQQIIPSMARLPSSLTIDV